MTIFSFRWFNIKKTKDGRLKAMEEGILAMNQELTAHVNEEFAMANGLFTLAIT